jgi:hypothetical protein
MGDKVRGQQSQTKMTNRNTARAFLSKKSKHAGLIYIKHYRLSDKLVAEHSVIANHDFRTFPTKQRGFPTTKKTHTHLDLDYHDPHVPNENVVTRNAVSLE